AALERWRGSPFADAANADWLRPVRTRLDDLRLQAHRELFEAELAVGRHHEVIPEARAILDEHPLREDLWAVYMLALYRAGRQADALRAYAEARRLLAEELGIDPSSQLQQLEERILAQDPTLLAEATPDPVAPESPTEPPDWSGEQRLVTILEARLVGTEPLVEALDPEAAGRAIADVIETMTATVDRSGGTVLGREPAGFVAVFGVPAAREDDTYQALRTAL